MDNRFMTRNRSVNSQKSQNDYVVRSATPQNFRACDSHVVTLLPIAPSYNAIRNGIPYNGEIILKYPHSGLDKLIKPYPTVMKAFRDKPYISLFGLDTEEDKLQKWQVQYKEAFEKEMQKNVQFIKSQNSTGSKRSPRSNIYLPFPKSKFCQICKQQYEDYEKHTKEVSHRRCSKESLGMEFIIDEIECFEDKKKYKKTECYKILESSCGILKKLNADLDKLIKNSVRPYDM